VREHLVRRDDLVEAVHLGPPCRDIRMQRSRQAAKSALDLDAARISAYAEYLVIVLVQPHAA
jgi:hypothetical protein